MYDERQLKGELSKLFAGRLLYKLSISPGCKYCGAVLIIINQVRLGARDCLGFTRARGGLSFANETSQWLIVFI